MRKRLMFLAPTAILALLLFIALGGAIVLWLWNWLLPPLLGWPLITFWQALGLLCLCRILFGGLGRHVVYRPGFRGRMAEHWMRLRPEEREQLRQAIRARFGRGASTGDSASNDA